MELEEKQMEFLNRLYVNIERWKNLRTRLPVTIGGLILALTGYLVNMKEFPVDISHRILLVMIVLSIGVFGCFAYYVVRVQYKGLSGDIDYLWQKLKMDTSDFVREERKKKFKYNDMADNYFTLGYVAIVLMTIIGISIILLR